MATLRHVTVATLATLTLSHALVSSASGASSAQTRRLSKEERLSVPACSAEDRRLYIYRENTKFNDALSKCGYASFGAAKITARCLVKAHPGLSTSCAACYGTVVNCFAIKCSGPCSASDRSPACVACAQNACIPQLVSCTGVPLNELPQREKEGEVGRLAKTFSKDSHQRAATMDLLIGSFPKNP